MPFMFTPRLGKDRMEKAIIGIGIVGMILISFASAGLVDFLSNTVTGEINVEGPVFYTVSGENLIMNEKPSSTTKTINGIEEIDFIMEEDLEGIDFYKPRLNFVVDLEINNFSESRGIELEFGYIKENGNSVRICNVQYVGIIEDGVIDNIPCDGAVIPTNIKHFYYTIEGMGDEYIVYVIRTSDSYVEITGVAP